MGLKDLSLVFLPITMFVLFFPIIATCIMFLKVQYLVPLIIINPTVTKKRHLLSFYNHSLKLKHICSINIPLVTWNDFD